MAEDRLTIDTATIDDNTDQRRVEFDAEVSGERYRFAVQYDVLEALAAYRPSAMRQRCSARIRRRSP